MTTPVPIETEHSLDLRGLKCPMPVLRTRKALRELPAGGRLVVACTDPLAAIDIPHLVREDGHRLESQNMASGVTTFHIVKGARGCRPPQV